MLEVRLLTGERLDLRGDEVIAVTYAVNDIGSIETRQGVATNEFSLPITDTNLRLLGYPTLFNLNQSVNPFTKIPAELFEEELRIAGGYLQIKNPNISQQVIPVTFFGENADVFSDIKGKSIRDLDLSEFKHIFQPSTITDSFTNTEGYKYNLIDRNGLNFLEGDNLPCQTFNLCVYQSTIVKAIIESIDFKLDGDILDDPLYKSTLIADTNNKFYSLDNSRNRTTSLGIANDFTVTGGTEETIIFEPVAGFAKVGDNYNEATGEYTFDTDYYAGSSPSIYIENNSAGSTDVTLRFKVNGVTIASDTGTFGAGTEGYLFFNVGNEFVNGGAFRSFEQGDVVTITVETSTEDITVRSTQVTDVGGIVGIIINGVFGISTTNLAVEGFSILPQAVLPDIDQADFIKEFVFDHNALVTVNLNNRTVFFNKKNYDVSNSLDWSTKIDLSENVEIDYTDIASNYNQINDIKRAETDGIFIKEYNSQEQVDFGDGQFTIDNDFLDKRGAIFESKFGASYTINSLNETLFTPYIIGEEITDVAAVKTFGTNTIVVDGDANLDDLLDIAANTVWALVTESTSVDGAYSISNIAKDSSTDEFTISINEDLTGAGTANVRFVYRNEEATPRKLIDAGVFDVQEISDGRTSFNVVSNLLSPEDSVTTTTLPYCYFWNPLKGNPTDNTFQSLSYGDINIPSRNSNLVEDYYTDTISQIQGGKILKASFRLTQVDIFNLDFQKLIFLNFTLNGQTIQGYFILNKIEEYTGNEDSTVVELIKY